MPMLALLLASCTPSVQGPSEKLYVAVEGENRVAVLDSQTRSILGSIDLSEQAGDVIHAFSPHNVQVAPDGKSVWVTANRAHGEEHEENGMNMGEEAPDQVIVIDPRTDRIIRRIPVGAGVHLAHVVVTKDGSFAYATAQEKGMIYKIDARSFGIAGEIAAPTGSEPHGLRISPDDSAAYVALLRGRALGILDLRTDALATVPLDGNAVQTGVTPDGQRVIVSLYDAKRIAVVDATTRAVSSIALPEGAKGPIQMYPTPDGRFVYVADQGYYFDQPTGNRLYKIDLSTRSVVKEIPLGDAPHGVVVSPDGKTVYVTNLLSGDVSFVDTASDAEIARIPVGAMPNGVSLWSRSSGGTP